MLVNLRKAQKILERLAAWEPEIRRDGMLWSEVLRLAEAWYVREGRGKGWVPWKKLRLTRMHDIAHDVIRHELTNYNDFLRRLHQDFPDEAPALAWRARDKITPILLDNFPELLITGHAFKSAR